MNFLQTILRTMFFWLDKTIYPLIGSIYNLFTSIAETTVIDQEIIKAFGGRIYALLGIFMLFKVSFSILNYIVNPDDMSDKNKGFSKLITNVLISLSLLVVTPMLFTEAYKLQSLILRDNAISNLILGSSGGVSSNAPATTNSVNAGREMGFQVFNAFYYLDEENYTECAGIYSGATKGNCANVFEENGEEMVQIIENSIRSKSVSLYLSFDLLHAKDSNDNFIMTYTPIVSTVCGVVICLILLSFCFDVAVRSIKLGFLQIVAPIPIISRIDPKSAKDGMFSKWVKSCTTTYLDLFIRLIAIYFAVFVIANINLTAKSNVTGEAMQSNGLVQVFIIIGALLFAKSLPQLLQDLTGMKMDGKFTINPMNKLRQTPILGAAGAMTAATVGGAITGGIAGAQAGLIGRGMLLGMSGARRDMKGKVNWLGDDKGKNLKSFSAGMQTGYKNITGKDFTVWSPWKQIGTKDGEEKVDNIKKHKYALQGEQAALDAQLQSLYDDYKVAVNSKDENKQSEIRANIEANRSKYGKLSKYISVLDDQTKDIKKLYNIDDSPKEDFEEAMAAASEYLKGSSTPVSSNPQPATPTTSNPQSSNQQNNGQPTHRVTVKPATAAKTNVQRKE